MIGFDDQGRFLHHCHCGAWGAFGFGVSLKDGKLGAWYCAAHRPESTMQVQQQAPPIPARYRAACEFCGGELNTQSDGVHQWTSGWVMQCEGGGGHGISLAVRANRWAHRHCVEAASHGKQGSLF